MYSLFRDRFGNIVVGIGTFASYMYCLSNYYWGLPMVDFRPYAVGKNINEGMQLPPGAIKDSVAMIFIYEKDGKKMELLTDQLGIVDSTFKFVDRTDKMIREGDRPLIHDFTINSVDGTDITADVLNMEKVFLLVANEISHSNNKVQNRINDFVALCHKEGIDFIGMTSSTPKEVDGFRHEHNSMFDYYYTDATTLKTMIRSNPGLMLLKKGTIVAMWHHRNFPSFEEVKQQYLK